MVSRPSVLPRPGNIDPFIAPSQGSRIRAICQIIIDGVDVTSRLDPYLINVHVIDHGAAEAHIELDDRDGRMPLPPMGAPVVVYLGWRYESMVNVFSGQVSDVEHGFGRKQGGRRMWVHAFGYDMSGPIKTPSHSSMGEGAPPGKQEGEKINFGDMAQKVFGNAGVPITVHKAFASQGRDHWAQNNESPAQWGERLSEELGGLFRLANNKVEITKIGENADGSSVGTIYAKWGDNLIGWRVHIKIVRQNYGGAQTQKYDWMKGAWDFLSKKSNNPMNSGEEANFGQTGPAANDSAADQQNSGSNEEADGSIGDGRIVINGEPSARFNGYVNLIGARPGVDGRWWIKAAEHIYSREGYITWLDVGPMREPIVSGEAYQPDVGDGLVHRMSDGSLKTWIDRLDELGKLV